MTVSSTTNRKEYAGNGATVSFSTNPVVFFDDEDLTVYVVNDTTDVVTTLTLNTDYTVSGGDGTIGAVDLTLHGAPASGETLVIVRDLAITQEANFVNNDASDAEVAEDALDRLTMISQQLDARLDRSFVLPDSDTSGASTELPTPEGTTLLGWDTAGTSLQNYSTDALDVALTTPFTITLLDDATAAAARTTLGAAASVVTTKGDLYVGGAAGAESRKAIGTNGKMLIADSAQTDGQLWAFKKLAVCGRLTLTTALPVTTSDVTGATTVYFTPYSGDVIELYDGAGWIPAQFTELSQATTDAAKSPAAVAASKNYDVFVWNDSGTLRATRGPTWDAGAGAGSDTARGTGAASTELEIFEGRYVNKNAITNGPAARKGLYVGTIRSDASSQINDSLAKRHVWNCYNRVTRPMRVLESTDSWTYTTAALRQMNNSAANQIDFVRGLDEDAVVCHTVVSFANSSAGIAAYAPIGLDSAVALAAGCIAPIGSSQAANTITSTWARWTGLPGLGRHFLAALEYSAASGTATWYGDNAAPSISQSGIHGEVRA